MIYDLNVLRKARRKSKKSKKTMSAQYTPVGIGEKVYDELVNIVRRSYKDACILYIDKVSNPTLEFAFEKRCKTFAQGGANIQRLFHGTRAEYVNSICTNGYDSKFNKRAAFGPGTYFSTAGAYSKDYTDINEGGESFLIVNKVALGYFTFSTGAKYDGDSGGDGKNIFVIRHDDAALPEYVICFHKNAKA